MYSKTLEYTNANGELVKSTKYFNLTKRELTILQNRYGGDLASYINANIGNIKVISEVFMDFIISSYGVKSEDGESFIKTDAVRESFEYSFYFAKLFDLFTNDINKFLAFMKGVIGITDEEWDKVTKDIDLEGEGVE